jgi:hypothetical protein
MAFTEIIILDVDDAHLDECSKNELIVPFILSATPPKEWKFFFEKQAPTSAKAKIIGNTARYKCPKDKAAIRRYGACWNAVVELVEDANRHCLEVELRRYQELGRKVEREHPEERAPNEFEIEWDRYMSRD